MKIRVTASNNYGLNNASAQAGGKIPNQQNLYETRTNIENPRNIRGDTAVIYEKGTGTMSDSFTYSYTSVKAVSSASDPYGKYKTYLSDMGFYEGAIDEVYDDEFRRALVCFQKAYGSRQGYSQVVDISGGIPASLKKWIQEVGAAFYTNLHNGKSTAAMKALGIEGMNFEKKRSFARILTFLEKGMGCTAHQAAGVLGNIMEESGFSPKSVNATSGALGILQWNNERKEYLRYFAEKHGYDEKNMGIQLAYFKYELSSTWGKDHLGRYAQNSTWVDGWKELIDTAQNDYNKASDIFYYKIEEPNNYTDAVRRSHAQLIYNAIK